MEESRVGVHFEGHIIYMTELAARCYLNDLETNGYKNKGTKIKQKIFSAGGEIGRHTGLKIR